MRDKPVDTAGEESRPEQELGRRRPGLVARRGRKERGTVVAGGEKALGSRRRRRTRHWSM